MIITKDTKMEKLLLNMPSAVSYFAKYDIKCFVSGNPKWGTIEELARKKNYNDEDIEKFVNELNERYTARANEWLK